jgi:hypothetical protein
MTVPDYHLGFAGKAAIGTVEILGLNNIKVPGILRETIKVVQFNQDFDFEVPTSANWEKGSMAGNYVRDDTTGQRALRTALFNNTGLDDLRLYEDADDFWAPDLANDANSVIFVGGMPGPEIDKPGIIPFSCDLLVQGLLALFTAHLVGVTLAFTAQAITDSGSGFVTAGFEVGQSIIIEGSTSNDTITDCIVTVAAAGELTVSGGPLNVEAAAGALTKVHGGVL